jgi:hypothetical protein
MGLNNRIYEGQALAVEYQNNEIAVIDESEIPKALWLNPKSGRFHILDFTPIGRLPIVVV